MLRQSAFLVYGLGNMMDEHCYLLRRPIGLDIIHPNFANDRDTHFCHIVELLVSAMREKRIDF